MRGPRSAPREHIVLFQGQKALHDIQARETLLSRFNHALHRLDEASQELDRTVHATGSRDYGAATRIIAV
jgi:hypothetical protein